jgi:hypothetical protein
LRDIEYVPIEDAPGLFILEGPSGLSEPHVLLFAVIRAIEEVIRPLVQEHRDKVYLIRKELVLSGLDMPWFCLGALGCASLWIIEHTSYDYEKPENAREALRKMLRYWDLFCRYDRRFFLGSRNLPGPWGGMGWGWAARPLGRCKDLPNVDEKEVEALLKVDPYQAADQIRKWVGM